MRVRVRLFAQLRELAGAREVLLELPPGATVAQGLKVLEELHPRLTLDGRRVAVAVNQKYVPADHVLADGDEVALIPPVSGGDLEVSQKPAFLVTSSPLTLEGMVDLVRADLDGAVDIFVGVVRNHSADRRVLFLEYEAYPEMAERVFRQIAMEIRDRWGTDRVAIHHRIGSLQVGEASVVIAVAAPHRSQAFEACRYAIERIKQIAPIWKKEHFEDGAVWVEGPSVEATF